MATWDDVRNRLANEPNLSASWKSDLKSLLEIFNVAEKWEISANFGMEINISTLRRMILPARTAIKSGLRKRLEVVFQKAAKLTYDDFLIEFDLIERETIFYKEVEKGEDVRFVVELDLHQLQRLERATKRKFSFVRN